MCFFYINRTKKIELLNAECDELCEKLDIAIGEANSIFSNPNNYIDVTTANAWISKYYYLFSKIDKKTISRYKKCTRGKELEQKAFTFSEIIRSLKLDFTNYNDNLIKPQIGEKHSLAENVEGSKSDDLRKKKTDILNAECSALCEELDIAIGAANSYFANPDIYIDVATADFWISKYSNISYKIDKKIVGKYKKCSRGKELQQKISDFSMIPGTIKQNIINHNDNLAKRQIEEGYRLIGNIEGRKLDKQQMMSIVKPSTNHLIIAGAGTGKTTTIIGKIKYLLKMGIYKPEDILVLSFTNASATEMSERINKEAECNIAASTFHKLGLEIIKAVEEKVPKIYSKPVSGFVSEQLKNLMENPEYLKRLCEYSLYHRNVMRTESDFSTQAEYNEYLSTNVPTTLKGEIVKSYGELDIANFLFQNQIPYEYEASYKFDTNTEEYGQYHPDFYLPDYDLYIEYFGIDRSGNVADYFKGRNGLSAAQTYQEGIDWKRKTHAAMNTSMVECFAYEKFENTLLENLVNKLKSRNITLNPLSSEELWEKVSEENNRLMEGIIELFGTVIALTKSNNYTFEYLEQLASSSRDASSNLYILSLIKPIYAAYNETLKKNNEIDFSDMINKATAYVREGKYVNPFKYVIVDEYQDISKARFCLLSELRKSAPYELFCVGDDWQSIYRFAGSDINFIIDFEKYWGPTEVGKIETTYRFTNSLIDISSGFIMQNPRQLKKAIQGMSPDIRFSMGHISGYTEKLAIQFMVERLNDLPQDSTVFFLGRYSFDSELIKDNPDLNIRYDNASSDMVVTYHKRRDLKMKYMTAHKSKGLQADYVFIINNKESRMGFPSMIQDASIMDLLLEKAEVYPFAEERRLFYVALTRARVKVFLVTWDKHESVFAKELINRYSDQLKAEKYVCPECGGKLIKKSGPYGEFFGCSNYGKNGCTYKRKIKG